MTTKAAETTIDTLSPYLCSAHESSSNYMNTASGLTAKLDYEDHLCYYLYGAMCYMGLKDWNRAINFLEAVLQSPTANVASKIQVDAYKKWVLVSLLRQGHVRNMTLRYPLKLLTHARLGHYQEQPIHKLRKPTKP